MTDREIVERLARDVMGWEFSLPPLPSVDGTIAVWPEIGELRVWSPLTSLDDAFILAKRMNIIYGVGLWYGPEHYNFPGCWVACFTNNMRPKVGEKIAGDKSLSRAICMAALETVKSRNSDTQLIQRQPGKQAGDAA